MKIAQVAFSSSGGAGKVASTLNEELRKQNYESQLIVATKNSLWQAPWKSPGTSLASALDEFVIKRRSSKSMISVARNLQPIKMRHGGFDVVHFHWWQGIDLMEWRLNNPSALFVFTMHDERIFTGGCHSTAGCQLFLQDCQRCPIVWPIFRPSVSHEFVKTRRILESLGSVAFTAPSAWMVDQAKIAKLNELGQISLVRNPLNPSFLDQKVDTPEGKTREHVFGFVAQNPDDPNKRLKFAEKVVSELRSRGMSVSLRIVGTATESSKPGVKYLGQLNASDLAREASTWSAFVSTSVSENSPLVFVEMATLGVPIVASPNAGSSEMLRILGQIPELPYDESDLSTEHLDRIEQLVKQQDPNPKYISAFPEFLADRVARDMLEIYQRHPGG